MTAQQIKDNTDLLIRQKTAQHSILKTEVAQQLDDIVDLIPTLILVTYLELLNLKNNSLLEIGRQYLLTDYMTEYIQPVTAVFKSSGIVEQLILTATDVNKLHNECKSILYPQDVVYYEITGDIDNGYGNEGFTKGKIYRRIDTLRNNDIGTDWRHVKYDRLGVDKLLFEVYDSTIYNNTIKTYFLFDNVCGIIFHSNTIGDRFVSNTIADDFQSNTIADDFQSNTIAGRTRFNTIGFAFYSNTIGNSFNSNTIGNSFQLNTIGDSFSSNTIGFAFYSNTIGDSFSSNTIGNSFSSNTIGFAFYSNTIGNYFESNGNITTPFLSTNSIFSNFINNINPVGTAEIQNQSIETFVYKTPSGTIKQRYYNNVDVLILSIV